MGDPILNTTTLLDGRAVLLEFDHGKANEMGTGTLKELERLVDRLRDDPRLIALITWSRKSSRRGTPIFVAGADVTERVGWDDGRIKDHVRWQRLVLSRLRCAPVFHVAVVHGVALGWGTEYLLTADYSIATPTARFALPETGLGILPGAGGTSELHQQIGVAHALRLGMTGEQIGADEALRIGLVQELADDLDAAMARARELAEMVGRRSPTAVAALKAAVLRSVGESQEQRRENEAKAYEHCVDTGEAAMGRAHFGASRRGEPMPWGPKVTFDR
ncbi:MAG: enoyl-CoA hydratase/carnithine racemase [Kiritimatiellia bacterium]|jgi:enoyl-CoA hydratase/carnithine racemase